MEAVMNSAPVKLTASAIAELKRLLEKEGAARPLRVGVKGGGCSGMTYVMEFDEAKEGDQHFEIDEVHLVMSKSHELYLLGMEVDFGAGLNDRGFVFRNPNASSTCGCGTSFSV